MGSTSGVPLSAVLAVAGDAAGACRSAVCEVRARSPESTSLWRAEIPARGDAFATTEQSERVAVSVEGVGGVVREIICMLGSNCHLLGATPRRRKADPSVPHACAIRQTCGAPGVRTHRQIQASHAQRVSQKSAKGADLVDGYESRSTARILLRPNELVNLVTFRRRHRRSAMVTVTSCHSAQVHRWQYLPQSCISAARLTNRSPRAYAASALSLMP